MTLAKTEGYSEGNVSAVRQPTISIQSKGECCTFMTIGAESQPHFTMRLFLEMFSHFTEALDDTRMFRRRTRSATRLQESQEFQSATADSTVTATDVASSKNFCATLDRPPTSSSITVGKGFNAKSSRLSRRRSRTAGGAPDVGALLGESQGLALSRNQSQMQLSEDSRDAFTGLRKDIPAYSTTSGLPRPKAISASLGTSSVLTRSHELRAPKEAKLPGVRCH